MDGNQGHRKDFQDFLLGRLGRRRSRPGMPPSPEENRYPANRAMQHMFFMELSDTGAGDEEKGDEDAPPTAEEARR